VALSGYVYPWASLLAPSQATGRGMLFDTPVLVNQTMDAGDWTATLVLNVSAGTILADLHTRLALYEGGVYVPLGQGDLLAQTLTTTPTTYTIPLSLPAISLGSEHRLYLSVWANVLENNTASGSATIAVQVANSSTQGHANCSLVTPGYTQSTQDRRATAYTFGDFCFHDGVNYLLTEKEFAMPDVVQTYSKLARYEGVKKTGETVNQKHIPVTIRVIAASRVDLERKIDALYGALSSSQQPLTLHQADGRYWVADAIAAGVQFAPGVVVSAKVPITFVAVQPYALSPSQSSYDTGSVLVPNVAGTTWRAGAYQINGGGTVFSRPTLTLINQTPTNNTTLSSGLTSGNSYTSLSVAALPAGAPSGTVFTLTSGGHTQQVTLSAPASLGATSLTVTSFTANFSYPNTTTTVQKDTRVTSITATQTSDQLALTVSSLTLAAGSALVAVGDPTASNGWQVRVDGGSPVDFIGTFPVMQPSNTPWTVQVAAVNQPTLQIVWTWTARWQS
jgi:hypothetical protein